MPARPALPVYNLPNMLTLARILMVPCFVVLMAYHRPGAAFGVFALASVTDFLDGLAARLLKRTTALGAFLDPLADKLLALSAFVLLTLAGRVELWITVVVVSRDLLVVVGFVLLAILGGVKEIKASWWGKAAAFLQMAVLSFLLLDQWLDLKAGGSLALNSLLGGIVILTALSGLDYILRGVLKFEAKKART